ncbi:conserved exported hypothetical protein [Desulfosarcina cetonica]|uniref:hypothetical protein n=1 Tax=Desulfosarcina cetonica TaxID=90730 RepID=UPI0006D26604|nr:hypothetical protein [Desulfosarcina cetonica]VTR69801.1 conserved exported hypothetical protein [Desulfosarcina cetonica]
MKKLIGVALATLFVAGIIANVAMADDRVQLNGEMRVRYWNTNTLRFSEDGAVNDNEESWFNQRLRVGTTINVADGVKVVSRMDFAEGDWGYTADNSSHWPEDQEIQVDRAYLQVDKGMIGVTAGQQLITLGNAIAYDNNGTGIKLDIKTPVLITLGYTKESERDSREDYNDSTNGYTADIDTYLIQLGYAADMFSVKGFYAAAKDGLDEGFEPHVFGLQGTFVSGIISVNAELNVFGGDISGVDVMGTQFWGNVEAAVMDSLTIGVDLIWSDGNDTDDEMKITALNDWTDWSIMDRGPYVNDIIPGGASDAMDPVPFGSIPTAVADYIADDLGIDTFSAEYGAQEGAIGGGLYAIFTPMEGLNLQAEIMYLSAENDDTYDLWNNAQVYSLAAQWFFAPNTSLSAQYHKTVWDSDYDELDDSSDVIVGQLAVNF